MNAYKCDICGSLYEDADMNLLEHRIDPFTGKEINFCRKELVVRDYKILRTRIDYNQCQMNVQPSLPPYRVHDVCPDCMKKIEDFCKLIRTGGGKING